MSDQRATLFSVLLSECAFFLLAPFHTKSVTLPSLLLTRHSLETQFKINESLNAMAMKLLNCLALRKLLFINILSSYGFFFLKCLIQWEPKLIWISLQTELLIRREDVLLFNIERLQSEDRAKKGVFRVQIIFFGLAVTRCTADQWQKMPPHPQQVRAHRGCSFNLSSTTDPSASTLLQFRHQQVSKE